MTRPCARSLVVIATFLLIGSVFIQASDKPPAPAESATGEFWEVTSQMSMEGMPMAIPPQSAKVCAAKDWKEPPAATDERQKCEASDFKSEGSKVSWKVRCAGPPAMTGEGEITRNGADAYTGLIKFASKEGSMKVTLSGRRVGGACELAGK